MRVLEAAPPHAEHAARCRTQTSPCACLCDRLELEWNAGYKSGIMNCIWQASKSWRHSRWWSAYGDLRFMPESCTQMMSMGGQTTQHNRHVHQKLSSCNKTAWCVNPGSGERLWPCKLSWPAACQAHDEPQWARSDGGVPKLPLYA